MDAAALRSAGEGALEADFVINPDYSGLEVAESAAMRSARRMVEEFGRVERAMGNTFNSPAVRQQMQLVEAQAKQSFGSMSAEAAAADRAAEKAVKNLTRSIETFGKTKSELASIRMDKLAADLERFDNTDAAAKVRALNAELNRLQQGGGKLTPTINGNRAAMAGLSYQAQDTFTQLSMGANVLQVLAIQGGQAAGQMAHMEGAAGKVANFMLGPWGLALTAGALVVGALTKGLFDGSDAADKKAEAAKELATAIDQMADSTRRATETEWESQRATLASAAALRQKALDARAATIETLAGARAKLADALAASAMPDPSRGQDGGIDFALVRAGQLEKQITVIDAKLAKQQADYAKTDVAFKNAQIGYMGGLVAARLDKTVGATREYEKSLAGLNDQFRKTGDVEAYLRARSGLETSFAAEKKAIEELEKVKTKTNPRAKRDPEAAKAEREAAAAIKAAQDYAKAQEDAAAKVGLSARELRLFNDQAALTAAPTKALKDAIAAGALAREKALTAQAGKDFDATVLTPLRNELALYGLVGPARARAALELEKKGFIARLTAEGLTDVQKRWEAYYGAKDAVIAKDAAKLAEDDRVRRMAADLDEMVAAANRAGDAMARAFGRAGGAIGDAVVLMAQYQDAQAKIDGNKDLTAEMKRAKLGELQLETATSMIGATKSLFSERSKAYKAMEAMERSLAVVQLARTAIDVAGGAAKMFSTLGPLGFPAVAAMLAVMATLGFRGGSAGSYKPSSNTGTGTVFGDDQAQSGSIKGAIDRLRDVNSLELNASRQMAASLRSIDNQIGGLAAVLVRSGNLNADSQVAQGFKTNAIGSVLGAAPLIGGFIKSLFGTTTTVKASGIYGSAMSLDQILAGAGYSASTYSDVERKKKFLGLTTSKKYSTVYGGAVDSSVTDQFAILLRSFNDAILTAAGPLGDTADMVKGRLAGFTFELGKLDLTGLSGTEIESKLAAVFGAAADRMASAAFPGITKFQAVGEGAFETLVRVASTVESVTSTLDQLGTAVTGLGIDAKVALAGQFDSIGDFTTAAGAYFDAFYNREEQATARAAQLTKVFTSLGVVMPRTIAGYRQLVDAQNLNTEAGRAAYATLLQLAPTFSDLMGSLGGAKTAADEADKLRDAWASIGEGIANEVKRIRGVTDSAGGSFSVLQGRFNAATIAARGGDQAMAKMLPELSQAVLAAAERSATSAQELRRVQAMTAASLEATNASIISRTNALTLDELLDRTATAQAATTKQAASDVVDATNVQTAALRQEIAQLRESNEAMMAELVGSSRRNDMRWMDLSDGDALKVRMA